MARLLRRLFGRDRDPAPAEFTAPLRPDRPFFAIGDIHGCDRHLSALIERLDQIDRDAPIICVGDYVDRGDASAQVLRQLMDRNLAEPERFICVAGNHEEMLLGFLDRPDDKGETWLRNGGLQTLLSFGIGHTGQTPMAETAGALREDMGPKMIAWLRQLPRLWRSGNVAVAHAGADPSRPIDDQHQDVLLWGHRDFARRTREDGIWVVHGHTIVDQASVTRGRISIDTGAYATGVLTAAHVQDTDVAFIAAPI